MTNVTLDQHRPQLHPESTEVHPQRRGRCVSAVEVAPQEQEAFDHVTSAAREAAEATGQLVMWLVVSVSAMATT